MVPKELIITTLVLFVLSTFFFYPGLMSFDSISQLSQARGAEPLTNWHPPVLTILWRELLQVTGRSGGMIILQQFVFWLVIGLFAYWLYRRTRSLRWSFVPFIVALLPPIFILSGTIWKDVHMAYALLFAGVLTLYLYDARSNRKKTILLSIIAAALIYALMVRHGVWLAVIPLALAAGLGRFASWTRAGVFAVAVVILSIIPTYAINHLFGVREVNVQAAIMIDDIVEISTQKDIRDSGVDRQTQNYLDTLKYGCMLDYPQTNRLFICQSNSAMFLRVVEKDYERIKNLWIMSIIRHPLEYMKFRAIIYGRFINPDGLTTGLEISTLSQDMNRPDLAVHPPRAASVALIKNAEHQTMSDLGILYKPYLWMAIGIVLLGYTFRFYDKLRYGRYIALLLLSGIGYCLSYVVFAIAFDYRYSYWLTLSVLLALAVFLVDIHYTKDRLRKKE